ncbi:MBL fold metallo-hydrolase [Austwickia chelonae]|uniref:MBL fold metallo-hydrolase n=1 Tax=Austwickia chelonae TaxID=100225 RepID=UPI000E23D225|nr:MBL fold metallo-hydrolase [Austwickia chelonae]
MLVTHLGHSCLLVEIADQRILIDPGTFTSGFEELTDLDAVLVTHQHPDHLDQERLPQLLRRNPDAKLLTDPETAAQLREHKFDVEELPSRQSWGFGDAQVEAHLGAHAVIHEDIPRIGNTGLKIFVPGEISLFHPGDALDIDPGAVDVVALPVNAPWCAMKESIDFVRRLAPKAFVPIHDGLLAQRGRQLYVGQIDRLAGEEISLCDLAERGPVDLAVLS